MNKFKLSLIALAFTAISSQAFATSGSASLQTTATMNPACVVAANNITFGTITPAATGTATATGTITSTCSRSVSFTLAINAGSGTVTQRLMAGAILENTDKLAYNLYTAADHTTVWGDGTTGSTVAGVGTGSSQTNTVYASLPLNQYLKSDTYTDNLTVTLTY